MPIRHIPGEHQIRQCERRAGENSTVTPSGNNDRDVQVLERLRCADDGGKILVWAAASNGENVFFAEKSMPMKHLIVCWRV
jgi:hypothetical protein